MGDLTKRRAARDLWISRSHVKAALVGAFLLSGVSFGLGYVTGVGGSSSSAPPPSWAAAQGYTEQVPGEDLVALLARVESNRAALGGVESLTFPDELARAADDVPVGPMAPELPAEPEPLPEPEGPVGEPVHIEGDGAASPDLPAPPVGEYTLQIATVADRQAADQLAASLGGCAAGGEGCPAALEGLSPWIGAMILDGELQYTVSLGGFASETAAEQALEGIVVLPDTRGATVAPIP
jgi:hypothetical protein